MGNAKAQRASVGGYFRVMTRPDLQGGSGKLGYWNLYGRLLNEGPYATLDFKFDLLEEEGTAPWTKLYARIEGGSIGNADAGNGNLNNLRLSQTYVLAGNILIPDVRWQIGTLDSYFGDLGLYDMRPAQIFFETVGVSGRYQTQNFELLVGVGDSGYYIKQNEYNTIFTAGGSVRYRPINHVEFGVGGQYRYEPGVQGNRNSPYYTPDVSYEDYLRGEVVENYLKDNPFQALEFPDPVLLNSSSYKGIGYLGFGGFGPISWNNFYASYELLHPESYTQETYQGQSFNIYTTQLTDQRSVLLLGNELQMKIIKGKWDLAWGMLYGNHRDLDNDLSPSDHNRIYRSTVLRNQWYFNDVIHLLVESSIASEWSKNGNALREHADSIFANTDGMPDIRGFEYGDNDTRITWQGKGGLVLNPMGKGIYTRPSLRILYGAQYSNQNNAFGNSFIESVDQYNDFGNVEQHWHHLVAVETEAWF
jgi:hypothetical protein